MKKGCGQFFLVVLVVSFFLLSFSRLCYADFPTYCPSGITNCGLTSYSSTCSNCGGDCSPSDCDNSNAIYGSYTKGSTSCSKGPYCGVYIWRNCNAPCTATHYTSESQAPNGCNDGYDNDGDGVIDGKDIDCCTISGAGDYYFQKNKFCINGALYDPNQFLEPTSDGGRVYLRQEGLDTQIYSCNAANSYGGYPLEVVASTNENVFIGPDYYTCLSRGWVKTSTINYDTDQGACTDLHSAWIDPACKDQNNMDTCTHYDKTNTITADFNKMNNCCGDTSSDAGQLGYYLNGGNINFFSCNYANNYTLNYETVYSEYVVSADIGYDGSIRRFEHPVYFPAPNDYLITYQYENYQSNFTVALYSNQNGIIIPYVDVFEPSSPDSCDSKTSGTVTKKVTIPREGYFTFYLGDESQSGCTVGYGKIFNLTIFISSDWAQNELPFCEDSLGTGYSDDSFISGMTVDSDKGDCCGFKSSRTDLSNSYTGVISTVPYNLSDSEGTQYYCNQWNDEKYHWTNDMDNEIFSNPNTFSQTSCEALAPPGKSFTYEPNLAPNRCCGNNGNADEGYLDLGTDAASGYFGRYLCYRNYLQTSSEEYDVQSIFGGDTQYGLFFNNNTGTRFSTFLYNAGTNNANYPLDYVTSFTYGDTNTIDAHSTHVDSLGVQPVLVDPNSYKSIDVRSAYIGKNPSFKFCKITNTQPVFSNFPDDYFDSVLAEPLNSIDLSDISDQDSAVRMHESFFWAVNITASSDLCSNPASCELNNVAGDYLNIVPKNLIYESRGHTTDKSTKILYNFSIKNLNMKIPADAKYLEFNFNWMGRLNNGVNDYDLLLVCNPDASPLKCVSASDYIIGSKQEGQDAVVMIPLFDLSLGTTINSVLFEVPLYKYPEVTITRNIGRFIKFTGSFLDFYCDSGSASNINSGWITDSAIDTSPSPDLCRTISPSFSDSSNSDTYKCCGEKSYIKNNIRMAQYPSYCSSYNNNRDDCTNDNYCECSSSTGDCNCIAKDPNAKMIQPVYENYNGSGSDNCCVFGKVFNQGEIIDMSIYDMPKEATYFYFNPEMHDVIQNYYLSKNKLICHDGTSMTQYLANPQVFNRVQSPAGAIVECNSTNVCDYTANYFCSNRTYLWEQIQSVYLNWDGYEKALGYLGGGFLKYRNYTNDGLSNFNVSECCAQNQCWNGEVCVNSWDVSNFNQGSLVGISDTGKDGSSESGNGKLIPYTLSYRHHGNQFACLYDGNGNGNWTYVYYKEFFIKNLLSTEDDFSAYNKLSYGYCLSNSQCWNGTDCVNSGTSIIDRGLYCDLDENNVGVWRHKTKLIINAFESQGQSQVNYDISCAKTQKVEMNPGNSQYDVLFSPIFNIWWNDASYSYKEREDYLNSLQKQYLEFTNISTGCVYQDDNTKAIGFVLTNYSASKSVILMTLNSSEKDIDLSASDCSGSSFSWNLIASGRLCKIQLMNNKYQNTPIKKFSVFYNYNTGILIISNNEAETFSGNPIDLFTRLYTSAIDVIRSVFGLSPLYRHPSMPDVSYSDYFYYGHFGSDEIVGYLEWIQNDSFVSKSLSTQYDYPLSGGQGYYSTIDANYNALDASKSKNIFEFSVNISGYDAAKLLELSQTINKLAPSDASSNMISTIDNNNLYVGMIVSSEDELFKLNSENDYVDYFGLFTRNLRTHRFS